MNTRDTQAIIEKLKDLPPERLAEVEDFIDFLRARAAERAFTRTAMLAAEPTLAAIWDNPADAEYDRL